MSSDTNLKSVGHFAQNRGHTKASNHKKSRQKYTAISNKIEVNDESQSLFCGEDLVQLNDLSYPDIYHVKTCGGEIAYPTEEIIFDFEEEFHTHDHSNPINDKKRYILYDGDKKVSCNKILDFSTF